MRDYKKLQVWEKAHDLVLFVYKQVIICYPKHEQFDLASQSKRAAYSITLNIVEGCGRNGEKDFAHFLDMSLGSAKELEYSCLLARDLNYLSNDIYNIVNGKVNEVIAMLISLIKTIRKNN
jgi:four helix bundle protein